MKVVKPGNPAQSQHPLAAEGGVVITPECSRDPYEVLDDLMVVVEALCPQWPPRETFKATGLWLL